MDEEKAKELFEDKYSELLGKSYGRWMEHAPQTEEQAYARCIAIDKELNASYDQWYEAAGEHKDRLEEQRARLKAEYDLIEDLFHLDMEDRNW